VLVARTTPGVPLTPVKCVVTMRRGPGPQENTVKRILSAAAVAALGLSLLTACGGDDGDSADSGDYCDDLKTAKKNLDSIEGGDLSSLEETSDQIHKLRDEAPDDIKDDWEVLSDGFDKIIAAFKKAGLDEDDIANLQSGQLPDDVDMDALQKAMTEIEELSGEEFTKAGDNISKHAKDECGVDLEA
jgi:hypothetical protein